MNKVKNEEPLYQHKNIYNLNKKSLYLKEQNIFNMEKTKEIMVNLAISFEQIWDLLQQLSDEKQVEMLDQLQGRLEKDGIIAIRQDRKAQYEQPLPLEQIANEPPLDIEYFKVEDLAFEDGEEIEQTESFF